MSWESLLIILSPRMVSELLYQWPRKLRISFHERGVANAQGFLDIDERPTEFSLNKEQSYLFQIVV